MFTKESGTDGLNISESKDKSGDNFNSAMHIVLYLKNTWFFMNEQQQF